MDRGAEKRDFIKEISFSACLRVQSAMRFKADVGLAERHLIGQLPNHQPLRRRKGDRSRPPAIRHCT